MGIFRKSGPTPEQIEQFVDGLGADAENNNTGKAIEAHRQATSRNPEADKDAADRLRGW